MKRILILISIFAFSVYSSYLFAQDPTIVTQIKQEYEQGDIDNAEYLSLRALKNPAQLSSEELLEVHKYLALCYIAHNERAEAVTEFVEVLKINPNFRFKRQLTSPKIMSIFEESLREFRTFQESQRQLPKDKASLIWIDSAKRSLIFPGLGQLHKGQKTKGYALISAEILSLTSLVVFQISYDEAHDDYLGETNPALIQSRYDDYNMYYKLRNASIFTSAAIYLYSLADCLYTQPTTPKGKLSFKVQPDKLTATINF
jgi:hypothetical protein